MLENSFMCAINSDTTSSNDDESAELILRDFLEGEVTLSHLQKILRGRISIDFDLAPGLRKIQDVNLGERIEFQVKEEHLCRMLRKYVAGEISEIDLSNWAALIFLAPFFVPEGATEEEQWQSSEGQLWVILQKLVAPSIFDGLNVDIAHEYPKLLSCNG